MIDLLTAYTSDQSPKNFESFLTANSQICYIG